MAQTREKEMKGTHARGRREEKFRNEKGRREGGKEGEGAAKKEGNLEAACIHT